MSDILRIQDLDKSFGGVHAVNKVSFAIQKGEILGLIGPNGSGKSTIVNLIAGTYIKDSGEVYLEDTPITNLSIARRARMGIGRTFQAPRAFTGLTVFDSVYTVCLQRYGYAKAEEKAVETLEKTGLLSLANVMSESLPIEKRKWLDLARILAMEPKLIMLDEVLAGLNPSEMLSSLELVQRINAEGITILFIEHVMRAVRQICHRVVVINEGNYLTDGTPEEVLSNEKVVRAYLGGGRHSAKH